MLKFTVIVSFTFPSAAPRSWKTAPDFQKKAAL